MKTLKRPEVLIGGLLFFLSAYLLYSARKLPSINAYGAANAAFWPTVILSIMIFLSLLLAGRSLLKVEGRVEAEVNGGEEVNWKRLFFIIILLFLWSLLMPVIGYLLSTFLFFGLLVYGFGERRIKIILIATLSVSVLIYLLFVQFLFIPFPRGMGPFLNFSLLFY